MFANTFQSGFISIFYSVGSNPLQLWDKQVKNGHIRRVVDDEVRSLVLEISGTNVATTYITCPIKPRMSLGIKLPFLVMIIKNMKKYFTFEIQILDDKDMHRRFRVSNFQSTTKVRPFCTTMPIGLSSGWNQVQFNLADFTKRAYGSTYLETTRVQIHANVRIRRIYFSDILYSDDELPNEYKLFLPTPGTQTAKATKPEKKELVPKEKKERLSKSEEEPPAGAPPSPEIVGEESPREELVHTSPVGSKLIVEPPSKAEEETTTESTSGEPPTTETEGGEPVEEAPPVEGGEAFEGAPAEDTENEPAEATEGGDVLVEGGEAPAEEAEAPVEEAPAPESEAPESEAAESEAAESEAPAADMPPDEEAAPPAEESAPVQEPTTEEDEG